MPNDPCYCDCASPSEVPDELYGMACRNCGLPTRAFSEEVARRSAAARLGSYLPPYECSCENSLVQCDAFGCRCTRCGRPPRSPLRDHLGARWARPVAAEVTALDESYAALGELPALGDFSGLGSSPA